MLVAAATATDQTTPLLKSVYLVVHTSPYFASAFSRELFMSQLPRTGLWCCPVAYPGILFGGGSTNSVENRENVDVGAVAP